MKYRSYILLTLISLLPAGILRAAVSGEWRLHPTFDNSVTKVIDTPTRVYFTGYNQMLYDADKVAFKSAPDEALFYYDKEGDEMVAAVPRHGLSSTDIRSIDYNPDSGYLLIVYSDQNIDLLYDFGEVRNIAALRNASIPGSKKINGVSFVPSLNQIWLATDFGYLVLDDSKGYVVESRNYGSPLSAAIRVGDLVILSTHDKTYTADASSPRLSLDDYDIDTTPFTGADALVTLSPVRIMAYKTVDGTSDTAVGKYDVGDDLSLTEIWTDKLSFVRNVLPGSDGYYITTFNRHIIVRGDKDYNNFIRRPQADVDAGIQYTSSWDGKEFFSALPRKGMYSRKLTDDKGESTLTRDFMRPNAPAPYFSRSMAYDPAYGMLVNSHGSDRIFNSQVFNEPDLLSSYKDGVWTPLAPAYRYPEQSRLSENPLGLLVDPDDSKYVYFGSNYMGLTRLNLDDPEDVLHITHPADPLAGKPGYVMDGPSSTIWERAYSMYPPMLDKEGNLWTILYKMDEPDRLLFRYWTPADRRASKDAASFRPLSTLAVPAPGAADMKGCFAVLTSSVNKNMLVYVVQEKMVIVDHKGTLDNTSDDTVTVIDHITDQDGGAISLLGANRILEDPSSGVIWIASLSGIFYASPRNLLQGQGVLNRVKVSRNDGTSLADYLLNGVAVFDIISDPQGRKWLATEGAGIVITSSDGKIIYDELSTENSGIPSDIVYSLCYNPASRSVMASTSQGLAEYFIGGAAGSASEGADAIRAYPNPVAPDYYGWVTIDGLEENTMVKITDASGNLIRDLGRAEGGMIQWDVLDMNHNRVHTGVYYILTSPVSGSGQSAVTKIMVMN